MTRVDVLLAIGVAAWAVGGCGHVGTAEKAAATALVHLTKYEADVGHKIRAETSYYDSVMDAASDQIDDLWSNDQPFRLEQEAKTFTLANLRTPADDMNGKLAAFLQGIAVEDLPNRSLLESADPDYQLVLGVVARRMS